MSDLNIKVAETQISKEDPWVDDKLGRKACAEMLTSLLAGQTTALTVSVNGEWGSGKTFLLKRWQQQLSNDGYKAIYFNAWEDDFIGDPLVAILGQLRMCLKEDANLTGLATGLSQAVWTLGSGLSKKFTGLDFEDAARKARDVAQSNRDVILDNYDTLCKIRKELKSSLQEMANELFNQTGKPLVFIVDELDRCRPTFAIETLERIKHLFDINHVIFVLGIDRKQLGESIKSVYGNIEIENYLHRFIDLDFQLPVTQGAPFFNTLWDRYKISSYLNEKSRISESGNASEREGLEFRGSFAWLLKWHKFSFREIEQCLKIFSMIIRALDSNHTLFPYLLPMLIVLKLKNKKMYELFVAKKSPIVEVINFLLPAQASKFRSEIERFEAVLYCSYMEQHSRNVHAAEVYEMIKAIEEKRSITDMTCAPPRLKKILSDQKELEGFRKRVCSIYDQGGLSGVCYDSRVLSYLANKMDFIMTGKTDQDGTE
jgi:Cdc6-like AAA superfamily ATPase